MQPAPRQDPRRRSDRRSAAENEDPGSRAIPIGAAVCGLDRSDTEGSFDRGQSEARVITPAGDEGLRSVLVVGATAVIQQAQRSGKASPWLAALLKRKSPKLAAVALANKMARIAWKLMRTGEAYTATSAAAAA